MHMLGWLNAITENREINFMDEDWRYSERTCPKCHTDLRRQDCWNCSGEGGFDGDDLMDEDPLWYDEDDYETCNECRGRGYFEWCGKCIESEKKSSELLVGEKQ